MRARYYRHKGGRIFLLNKEILPNGKILRYQYTDTGVLSLVESLDPKERYVYASIRIQGSPQEGKCNFTSSTGLNASYTFDNQRVQGKFREGKQKTEYTFTLPPMMTAVSSPQYRGETSAHTSPNCLLQSFAGKDETFTLNQAPFGDGDKVHLRVDKLLLPAGANDSLVPVYQMAYQPAIGGEREGKTTVKNCDGTSTVYHFSKNLLTTLVQYFGQDGALKKEKAFSWNDKSWLNNVELRDDNKRLLLRKSYEYDSFGNPTSEILVGDLTGDGKEDRYIIKREFSQDGRNLLLKEESEDGKITTFEYLPKTDLITLKCIKDGSRTLIRESFQYDDCHNLIQKSIDDGGSQKRITQYALRQQQPFLHMPEWIEEKYADRDGEQLLRRTHLSYDQYGNVAEEKIYDSNGQYAYSLLKKYNERGDLLSETNPLGQERTFVYDNKGRCIEETNFSQNLTEKRRYDTKGRLLEEKTIGEDGIHTVSYQYDCNDDLIQKIDSYNNVFSYSYDPLSHKVIKIDSPAILTSSGQATPVVTRSTYDAWGREISKADANGNTIHYRYNAYDSPIEVTYPNGSKESYHYTKGGRKSSYTDPDGLTIHYTHDVLDRVISKNYGKNPGQENFHYDSFNLLEENDLEGNVIHYLYDGSGRKIYEEKSGRVTTFAYDPLGRLAEIKKEGLRTYLERDLVDRLIEETKTDSNNNLLYKVNFAYDEDGNLNKITRYIDGKESVESFVFDAFSRETLHRDPLGHKTTTVYNENHPNELGQRVLQITTVDPLSISTVTTQDPYSKDVQEKKFNPQGNTISCWEKTYDACGNLTDWKDYLYEDTQLQNIQIAHFTYTTDNKIKSSTRAFRTSEERATYYTYTPSGKTETKTLPDGTILTYAYTPLGYLEKVNSSDGKIRHRFECNKKGELLRILDEKESISIQREVDPFGNVTREVFPNRIDVAKSYDSFDRLLTLQITDVGQVAFNYDPLYLRGVSRFSKDGKLQYTHLYENYDLDGNLLSESMINNSGKIQHRIDLKGRKTEIASPYFSQKCVYDAGDNLTKSVVDQQAISYAYDDLSQLTGESDTTYAYDSLFNRRMKDGKEYEVNDLNELKELTYDLNGNQIQKDQIHYTYDPLNRLIEATLDTRRIHFQYDPLGRRLSKAVMNKSSSGWKEAYREHYLYDGKNEIGAVTSDGTLKNLKVVGIMHKQIPSTEFLENNNVEEIDQTEGEQDTQFHGDLLIDLTIPTTVAVELNQKVYAPIMDVQKNICRLVDPSSKKVVSRYDFSAFGEELARISHTFSDSSHTLHDDLAFQVDEAVLHEHCPRPLERQSQSAERRSVQKKCEKCGLEAQTDENPWRFAAKRFDPELNLIYFGKRYYDPELGRWLATDPAGFVDSLNLYQYVLNNPFRYYDPDGEIFFLALAIPLGQLICGSVVTAIVVEAVVDAVIAGAVAVAAWEGSKYVNNTMEKKRIKNKDKEIRGEHHTNIRESNRGKDEKGRARKQREQRNADAKKQKIRNKAENKKQQNKGKK
jgi:RHS repeat-associated protein